MSCRKWLCPRAAFLINISPSKYLYMQAILSRYTPYIYIYIFLFFLFFFFFILNEQYELLGLLGPGILHLLCNVTNALF